MPIIQPPAALVPLSSGWTHARIVTYVRMLSKNLDSKVVNNELLRYFLNAAITQVADMMRLTNRDPYGILWEATKESAKVAQLNWIDLSTVVAQTGAAANSGQRTFASPDGVTAGSFVPMNIIDSVERVTAIKSTAQSGITTVWTGPCTRKTVQELSGIATELNDQYRQSILWAHHGHRILLYLGSVLDTDFLNPPGTGFDYNQPERFAIWGRRVPMLDNLQAEDAVGSSWLKLVDIPDAHIRLLVLLMQKQIAEATNQQMEQASVQELMALVSSIGQTTLTQEQRNESRGSTAKNS